MEYKLIKEYPGSPKLGTIVKVKSDGYIHWNVNSNNNNPTNYIHSSSMKQYEEFWEEVVEKDYEILSFVNNGSKGGIKGFIVPLQDDGKYYAKGYIRCNYDETLENQLKESSLDIYSVKRNDGKIFTIGDKIIESKICGNKSEIKRFNIYSNKLIVEVFNKSTHRTAPFSLMYKDKQPLFKTEDGVDIFEGDTYYKVVNKSFQLLIMENASKGESLKSKVFSTKEKAEEYILMNKPCLSLADVASIYKGINKKTNHPSSQANQLKQLVKYKLKL